MKKKVYLFFPKSETERPIVYHLIRDYDLMVNIYRAKVTPEEYGYLSLEISGTQDNIDAAYEYLKGFNVEINESNNAMIWKEDRCVHCTNCTVHCPTKALHITDATSRKMGFDELLCIECFACIDNCPFGACIKADE